MILKLQVNHNGKWGTINARQAGDGAEKELNEMLARWQTNYVRFRDAAFRIIKEER